MDELQRSLELENRTTFGEEFRGVVGGVVDLVGRLVDVVGRLV